MFNLLATLLPVLAVTSTVLAQDCYFCNRSAPFRLVVESSNSSLNNLGLISLHSGAAIETFGVGGQGDTYYYNYSSYPSSPGYPPFGYLTWILRGSGFNVSEPMSFSIDPASNVALPLLTPGSVSEAQGVSFTSNSTGPRTGSYSGAPGGYLAVASNVDDSVVPAASRQSVLLERWNVCQTYFGGYRYNTLAWTLGSGPAQNPTCQKVRVKRVFI